MTHRIVRSRSLPSRRNPVTRGSAALPPDRARRMRIAATLLLVAMAGLFLFAHHMLGVHPAWV